MFTKQNKIKSLQTSYVYKTQYKNTLCLQNKNVQTSYVYKTKTKQKVYKRVIFTKQKQNKKFTDKLCLQNKVYKHVMFTKQKNYRQVMFTKQNKSFTNFTCLQNKTQNRKVTNTLCL